MVVGKYKWPILQLSKEDRSIQKWLVAGGIIQLKCRALSQEAVRGFLPQALIRSAKELVLWVKVYFYLRL